MDGVQQGRPELIGGPYRSGKTLRLISELIEFKQSRPFANVLVAVPSSRYHTLVKERAFALARETGLEGVLAVDIVPFYHVCRRVLDAAGVPYRVLPDEVRLAMVREILKEMKHNREIHDLQDVFEFHGTAQSIAELIDEFQRASLTPNDVLTALKKQASCESRYMELAHVYERYWQTMNDEGFFDLKRIALKARDVLHSNKLPDSFRLDLFAADGFDRISRLQAQVLAGIARRSQRTIITFDYDFSDEASAATASKRGEEPCAASASRLRAFESSAASESSAYIKSESSAYIKSESSAYIWKHASISCLNSYFDPKVLPARPQATRYCAAGTAPDNPIDDAPGTRVVEVSGFRALDRFLEMQEIANRCKEAVLCRSIPAEEILVVCRSIDHYRGAVESSFEAAGLSCFIDASIEISTLNAWHFLRRLVSLSSMDYPRRELIDLLRSPYFKLAELGITMETVSSLDRQSYNQDLVGGRNGWLKFAASVNQLSAVEKILNATVPPQAASASSFVGWIEDLIDTFMCYPASQIDARTLRATEEREVVKAVRAAARTILLEERVLGSRIIDYEDFLTQLNALVDNSTFACPHPAVPSVTVCSAELAPNRLFREVFIAGMLEGEFPKRRRDRGFLGAGEVARWLSFGIDLRDPRSEPGFEKALFFSLIERASSRVCMSLPQFDISGDELTPTFYLKEMEGTSLETKIVDLEPYARACKKPSSAIEFLSACLWHSDMENTDRLASSIGLAHVFEDLSERAACVSSRLGHDPRNVYNGYLCDLFETGALTNKLPEAWTASKLNQYGQCPFRYWVSNVLKVEPREETESGLTVQLRGQFYHKALEIFFREYARLTEDDRYSEKDQLVEKSFAEGIVWLESQREFQPSQYWFNEKNELLFRFARFVDRELLRLDKDVMQPAAFEVQFGFDKPGSGPALIIDAPEGEIRVRGTIDRIDIPAGLNIDPNDKQALYGRRTPLSVIDYKTGSTPIHEKDAAEGRNLQVPIYALAAERCIYPGTRVASGNYLSVSQARSIGRLDFDNKNATIKDSTEDYIRKFVRRIAAGEFTVAPNSRQVCNGCPHSSSCRIRELGLSGGASDASFD